MNKYSKMTTEDFDAILIGILKETTAAELLTIPGVYEIVSEHYNDEVLEPWESSQEA